MFPPLLWEGAHHRQRGKTLPFSAVVFRFIFFICDRPFPINSSHIVPTRPPFVNPPAQSPPNSFPKGSAGAGRVTACPRPPGAWQRARWPMLAANVFAADGFLLRAGGACEPASRMQRHVAGSMAEGALAYVSRECIRGGPSLQAVSSECVASVPASKVQRLRWLHSREKHSCSSSSTVRAR